MSLLMWSGCDDTAMKLINVCRRAYPPVTLEPSTPHPNLPAASKPYLSERWVTVHILPRVETGTMFFMPLLLPAAATLRARSPPEPRGGAHVHDYDVRELVPREITNMMPVHMII